MNRRCRNLAGLLICALAGCAETPSEPTIQSMNVAREAQRAVPELRSMRFSTLLDFETDSDPIFVSARSASSLDASRAHTGVRGLRFERIADARIGVKLASLLAGREFPGEWTLLGGYFYADSAMDITVSVEDAGVTIPSQKYTIPPRTWTAVMCDLGAAAPTEAPLDLANLVFTISSKSPSNVWLDDILLIDNTQSLVAGDSTPEPQSGWSIQKRGLRYLGESPRLFSFTLATVEASPAGWWVEEVNELRARFASNGKVRAMTVYSDGRAYWDGNLKPMSAAIKSDPAYARQHESPAELLFPQDLGQLNRSTPGDVNNDGYNETRGAYQIVSSGSRLEVQVLPRSAQLVHPILEITGIPKGDVLVTMQGALVEEAIRLADGAVLIELPGRIDKPVTVNIRLR